MADDDKPVPPPPVFTEQLPARADGISAIASANAPFIYFDGAPNFGVNEGIVNITIEALRFIAGSGEVLRDRVTVAHLRTSLQGAARLRDAIDKALQLAAGPERETDIN